MKYLLLPMTVLVLTGCVTTEREAYPHLDKVDVEPLPADYSARSSDLVDATTDTKADHDEGESITAWLISFNSPELELLVITALNRNYDLKQQALGINLAEQSVKITGASLLPTLNFSLNAQRSDNNLGQTNQFGLGLSASYEVDLWGRLKTSQKQAQINLAGQKAKYQLAERTLVRDVINASFDVSSAKQLLGFLSQRLENLSESLDVIERGYRSGLNSALDVYLARNTLELERAGLANQHQIKFEALTTLKLLLGAYPDGMTNVSSPQLTLFLKPIDAGIPSELLQRRPDIELAWLNLLAADAGVAIAHRNRFPSVNLSASINDSKHELDQLLNGGALAWSIAASLVQPLFQGGRLAALESQAKVLLEQQEKRYLEIVFLALADVENELSREQALAKRVDAFIQAEQNAVAAQALAFDQYQRGLVSYTTVLESQRRAFDAETTLIQLRNQQLKNRANLLLALGGNY
jgi:multidrug efflux system outer membrane protein